MHGRVDHNEKCNISPLLSMRFTANYFSMNENSKDVPLFLLSKLKPRQGNKEKKLDCQKDK